MKKSGKSPLIRNILAVATGTAAGQAIVFAFSPLITRIYTPEIFGVQGVFLSLISILSPLVALRYPMAIVIADDDDDAGKIARLSVLVAFVISSLLGLLLLVAQQPVLRLLGAEALGNLIWLLPLALFCVALQDVADFYAARLNAFRLVGVTTVIQAFLSNLARVLGGLASPVAGVLVLVTTLAPSLQALILRCGLHKHLSPSSPLKRSEAVRLLRRYRDFPRYRMPTDVLNAASQSVPVIMLGSLFSPAAAGLYVLTRSVLNLPGNIIGSAVGNVLYARYAELDRQGKALMPLLLRSTAGLMLLAPVIVAAAWFAPTVFAFVFGEEWREAGHYARWMALWIGVALANVPAVRLAPVIEAQNLLFIANVLMLILRVFSIMIIYWHQENAATAVAAFSLVSLFSNIGLILLIGNAAYRHEETRSHNLTS